MEQIVSTAKRKIILFVIFGALVVAAGGLLAQQSVKNAVLLQFYSGMKTDILRLSAESREFAVKVNEAKRTGNLLANIRYGSPSTLRETLFRELESMDFFVSDISLKEREDSAGIKSGIIEVSITGSILMEKIPSFLEALSSRPKIWGVESLDITPKISPAELVGEFLGLHRRGDKAGVEKFLLQGESLLEDEKSSLTDVELKILVVAG